MAGGLNHERTQRRICRIGDRKGDFGETKGRADQKKVSRARKLLRSYSRLVGSQAPDTKTMQDLSESGDSIDKETLHKYLLTLQRQYAAEELKAWNPNLRSKTATRTSNARYFVDLSIAVSALGATSESLFLEMNTFGFLFESLVIRCLYI